LIYEKALTEKEKNIVVAVLGSAMAYLRVPPDQAEQKFKELYAFFMTSEVLEHAIEIAIEGEIH